MAAAVLFGASSCVKEDISSSLAGGEVEVTLTIDVPELATRADGLYGDGMKVNQLFVAVYEQGGTKALATSHLDGSDEIKNGKAYVTMVLLTDKTYDLVFWAQVANTGAYTLKLADGRNIVANYDCECNLEDRDAFFLIKKDWKAGRDKTYFSLQRPFAQINVANSDEDKVNVTNNGATIVTSKMTVASTTPVYTTLNLSDGSVSGEYDPEFAAANIPDQHPFHIAGYNYLAMNYLLVNVKQNVDLEFVFADQANTLYTRKYYNVPVQRNYRTNILGNILSSEYDFTVEIDPIFEGVHEVAVWDGTISEPSVNQNGEYEIAEPSEFAWLAAAVNGTLPANTRAEETLPANSFAGKTFVLADDINLGGQEWTPIGTSANPFKGTFDGNGKTIYDLMINAAKDSNIGLFGFTTDGEVKNFTVQDAKVSGRMNVGVVAGTPYTTKYTNITVKGHVEVNGMAYVGGVGGKNAYADWTNITVNVDETSYVNANSVENGTAYRTYVGGVVGFNGEGGHKFSNISSNIAVEGSTCDVGGLFGIAHYGNQFENCVCTGNVTITTDEVENALEMGGIAGVWHNENGTTVSMTNCSFTGELSTPNIAEEVAFYYGGLVGKPYGEGSGVLVLNGTKFDKNGAVLNYINEILKGGEYAFPFDLTGTAAASNGYGKTGINHGGYTLDGKGHTLKVNNAGATWDSALATNGGTIKNLTVAKGFRGIFIKTGTERVILENVTIEGPTYTISCDTASNQGLSAYNSTFNGWTSYAATLGEAYFEDCSFGAGAGYKFARPYAPTTFVRCNFCEGFEIDARANVVLVDCTVGGVAVTAENIATLVTSNTTNASLAPVVASTEALTEALASTTYVKVAAGQYTFPSSSVKAGVIIECAEGTVFTGNSKLNIQGSTVIGATFSNPSGTAVDQTINGTFKNCTFEGSNALRWCYAGETVVFENCVFSGSTYGIHFDGGAKKAIFRDCTISGFNAFASDMMVTFEGCTFEGNGKSGYNGANLWGSAKLVDCQFAFDGTTANEWIDCIGVDKTYEFENCTINGVAYTAENYATYTKIFSRNNATVKINGVECEM